MPPVDLCLPSIALDIATEIGAVEGELERLLNLYVGFEEGWNRRFKAVPHGGDCAALIRLQEERAVCEADLGIGALVERACRLREGRTFLSNLVGMAAVGASRETIAARAERFFSGGRGTVGPVGLEAWWLAGSLMDWVSQPIPGSDADMDIRITWRGLERLAADGSDLSGPASG
jgi:hypothetical protein